MFRPGGKYYTPPKNSGGIDEHTRQELSGILNGILTNLQHSKAALPQIAQNVVSEYKLSGKEAGLILDMYESVDDDKSFNSANKDMQAKAKVVLASVLQKVDSSYTPRMFAPGGKYYNPPHFGRSSGISEKTRQEVGDILKGILGNLMKHKAALTQAKELVQQYHLSDKSGAEVTEGLKQVYDELQTPAPGDGLKKLLKDEKALPAEHDRSQASAVLALVIQQANSTYSPGSYRPRRYTGYTPSRSRGLGISEGTRQQVSGILKGILENLMKHKAALGQISADITRQVQGNPEVLKGLQETYTDLNDNESAVAGVGGDEVEVHLKTVLASVLHLDSKVTKAVNMTKANVTKH